MNANDRGRHEERLKRASDLTSQLMAADGDLKKMAALLTSALLPQISKTRIKHHAGGSIEPSNIFEAWGGMRPGITRTRSIVTTEPGLRMPVGSLEDLIAFLLASDIYPAPASKPPKKYPQADKKSKSSLTYSFFLGAFSELARRSDLELDLKRICEAGRDEALALTVAAVFCAETETFDGIQKGITAVMEIEFRHNTLSRHAAAARQAYRDLINSGLEPVKAQVREATIDILKMNGTNHYSANDSARWREVYRAAGLTKLKQQRGIR